MQVPSRYDWHFPSALLFGQVHLGWAGTEGNRLDMDGVTSLSSLGWGDGELTKRESQVAHSDVMGRASVQ